MAPISSSPEVQKGISIPQQKSREKKHGNTLYRHASSENTGQLSPKDVQIRNARRHAPQAR